MTEVLHPSPNDVSEEEVVRIKNLWKTRYKIEFDQDDLEDAPCWAVQAYDGHWRVQSPNVPDNLDRVPAKLKEIREDLADQVTWLRLHEKRPDGWSIEKLKTCLNQLQQWAERAHLHRDNTYAKKTNDLRAFVHELAQFYWYYDKKMPCSWTRGELEEPNGKTKVWVYKGRWGSFAAECVRTLIPDRLQELKKVLEWERDTRR